MKGTPKLPGNQRSVLPETLRRRRFKLRERKKDHDFAQECADRDAERQRRAAEVVARVLPDYEELPLGYRRP